MLRDWGMRLTYCEAHAPIPAQTALTSKEKGSWQKANLPLTHKYCCPHPSQQSD